jgi:hypothetical protein
MSRKWTEINESLQADRNLGSLVEFDMGDMEADMAISEALTIAAEGKYIAGEILESFFDFNKVAEDRGYDAMEYIAEAFSVGGFFKKIIDILVNFWGVIVNFFKAMFSKIGGTDGTVKTLRDIKSELEALAARDFKEVAGKNDTKEAPKLKIKQNDLDGAATMALALLDAKAYLEYKLKGNDTLITITDSAVTVANSVKPDDDGKKPGLASGNAATAIEATSKNLEELIKEVGLGDKGAAQILLKMFNDNAAIKGIVEKKDSKVKDAKKVSEILKALSQSFFPKDAETVSVGAKERIGQLAATVNSLLDGSKGGTSERVKVSAEALVRNGFEEARKQAQDVLDKLKEAAKKIGAVKASSFDTKVKDDADATKANEEAAGKTAEAMGKLSTNLMEIQSSMQAIITGGMDAGVALLKAVTNELNTQTKAIAKMAGSFERYKKED